MASEMRSIRAQTRLDEWIRAIKQNVEELLLDHHIFWEVQKVFDGNERFRRASGVLQQWMAMSFARATAVGIRREAKGGRDSISLKRLLQTVHRCPGLVSADAYLALFDGVDESVKQVNREYFSSIADTTGRHLDPKRVESQMAELHEAVSRIEHFVDRRVAHYDERGPGQVPLPTFGDLEIALQVLERLTLFYWTLLTGGARNTLLRPLDASWRDIFTFRWVEESNADPDGWIAESRGTFGSATDD